MKQASGVLVRKGCGVRGVGTAPWFGAGAAWGHHLEATFTKRLIQDLEGWSGAHWCSCTFAFPLSQGWTADLTGGAGGRSLIPQSKVLFKFPNKE